jgi:hypothetical protein
MEDFTINIEENTGSIKQLYYAPVGDVLYISQSNTGAIADIGMAFGKKFYSMDLTRQTGNLGHNRERSKQNEKSRINISGFIPGSSADLIDKFDQMKGTRFIVIAEDFDDLLYVLGTKSSPMRFSYDFNTGANYRDRKGFQIRFEGNQSEAIQLFTGTIPQTIDYTVRMELGDQNGSNTYRGACRCSLNNKIYFAPFNADRVIEYDPQTNTLLEIGSDLSAWGSSKWWGIAEGSDGMLYCAPYDADAVLKIDPLRGRTKTFGSISGNSQYRGLASGENGFLYCAGFDATNVLKINEAAETVATVGSLVNQHQMAALSNGKIFFAPYSAHAVYFINIDDDTVEFTSGAGLSGDQDHSADIKLGPDGLLYTAPYTAGQVLQIDPVAETHALVGQIVSGSAKWVDIIPGDEDTMILMPRAIGLIGTYNITDDTLTTDGAHNTNNFKGIGAAKYGGSIYAWDQNQQKLFKYQ